MKYLDLDYNKNRFEEFFNDILKKSGGNLNQYIDEDTIELPKEILGGERGRFEELLDSFIELIKEYGEEVFNKLEELDCYEQCNKFIDWLRKYVESKQKSFEETKCIRELSDVNFKKLVEECFETYILCNNNKGKDDLMKILQKLIIIYIELIIVSNFPRDLVYTETHKLFDMPIERSEYIWDLVQKNEEKLWKIIFMNKIIKTEYKMRKIESKINIILDEIL